MCGSCTQADKRLSFFFIGKEINLIRRICSGYIIKRFKINNFRFFKLFNHYDFVFFEGETVENEELSRLGQETFGDGIGLLSDDPREI